MKDNFRFIVTGRLDPYSNMALDEALFLSYRGGKQPVLRVYGWSVPSFSIGYSQRAQDELDCARCEAEGVPYVRRITGGGILFHDRELTYSLVCGREDIPAWTVIGSFRFLCGWLIRFYRNLGLEAGFAFDSPGFLSGGMPSALCLAGRQKYDILIRGRKIGGNAQKRTRDTIFQHGSIPLSLDLRRMKLFLKSKILPRAYSVCSLGEMLKKTPSEEELIVALRRAFEETFSVSLCAHDLTEDEKVLFRKLREEKYRHAH